MTWFKEELFLIPNWAWFVIIVGIFCILMAIVIVTCVRKGDKGDDEPVLMEENAEKPEAEPKAEETVKAEEVKEEKHEKTEEVVYTEPEPVLVEEPVQPIKEEKKETAKPAAKKTATKSSTTKTAATKTTTAKTEKPAEKKTAAKTTAKTTSAKTASAKTAEKPAAKTTAKTTAAKTTASKTAAKKDDDDKVYHISKRKEDKKWQVKAEGSSKALKLFFTQEEAIDYAKSVAGNQEGRIVIHKEDGGFRKLKY